MFEENKTESNLLISKYAEAVELYLKMTRNIPSKRPNCEEMLKEKNMWALSLNDLETNETLNNILKASNEKDVLSIESMVRLRINNKSDKLGSA